MRDEVVVEVEVDEVRGDFGREVDAVYLVLAEAYSLLLYRCKYLVSLLLGSRMREMRDVPGPWETVPNAMPESNLFDSVQDRSPITS